MTKERPPWLVRLTDEIRKRAEGPRKIAFRQIAIASGLGPNYVTQLMNDRTWKEPVFGNVVKLCETLNVSITYVVTGANMTQREERMLRQLGQLDEQQQEHLLALLQTFPRGSASTQ